MFNTSQLSMCRILCIMMRCVQLYSVQVLIFNQWLSWMDCYIYQMLLALLVPCTLPPLPCTIPSLAWGSSFERAKKKNKWLIDKRKFFSPTCERSKWVRSDKCSHWHKGARLIHQNKFTGEMENWPKNITGRKASFLGFWIRCLQCFGIIRHHRVDFTCH